MNIDIPQPTVIERLKIDREREIKRLKALEENNINPERQEYTKGVIRGLDWAITNLEINA